MAHESTIIGGERQMLVQELRSRRSGVVFIGGEKASQRTRVLHAVHAGRAGRSASIGRFSEHRYIPHEENAVLPAALQAFGSLAATVPLLQLAGQLLSASGAGLEALIPGAATLDDAALAAPDTFKRTLRLAAARRPFLLCLDDLSHAPRSVLDALEEMSGEITSTLDVLVVATVELVSSDNDVRIRNDRLGDLVSQLTSAGSAELRLVGAVTAADIESSIGRCDPTVLDTIMSATLGRAAHIADLVSDWLRRDVLVPDPDSGLWRFAAAPPGDPWVTLRDVVYERLRDRCPPDSLDLVKEIVRRSAILASASPSCEVVAQVIAESLAVDGDTVIDAIDDWVSPTGLLDDVGFFTGDAAFGTLCAYRFPSRITAEAVVNGLAEQERQAAARSLAAATVAAADCPALARLIATLFEQAGDQTAALTYSDLADYYLTPGELAGRVAFVRAKILAGAHESIESPDLWHALRTLQRRCDLLTAISLAEGVLAIARSEGVTEVVLGALGYLGDRYGELGDQAASRAATQAGLELAVSRANHRWQATFLLQSLLAVITPAGLSDVTKTKQESLITEALECATVAADAALVRRCWYTMARVRAMHHDQPGAEQALAEAEHTARNAVLGRDDEAIEAEFLVYQLFPSTLWLAADRGRELMDLGRRRGRRRDEGVGAFNIGIALARLGFGDAVNFLARSWQLAQSPTRDTVIVSRLAELTRRVEAFEQSALLEATAVALGAIVGFPNDGGGDRLESDLVALFGDQGPNQTINAVNDAWRRYSGVGIGDLLVAADEALRRSPLTRWLDTPIDDSGTPED